MATTAAAGRLFSVLALAATVSWLAAACGGGGGGASPPDTALDPAPNPPAVDAGPPRIEPYERTSSLAALRELAASATTAVKAWSSPILLPAAPAEVRLGPLPLQTLQAKQAAMARPLPAGQPREIGLTRALPSTADADATARLLAWQVTASGGRAARLRFRAEGAAGLRLALQASGLPQGAQVRVEGAREAVTVDAAGIKAWLENPSATSGLYWLPPVAGEAVTLEVDLPPGADPAGVRIAVPRLAHLWWTHAAVTDANALKIGEAGSCNVDATCAPDFEFDTRSVARMEFVDGDSAFLCTGTLMADTLRSGIPYFLGANHCIHSQEAASTVSTYWFYRAAGCNLAQLDPAATAVHGGASLLYASGETDTAFMQLNASPPVGTVHAGSLLVPPDVGAALATLHHPGGDLLKLSRGTLQSYASCNGVTCTLTSSAADSNYLVLQWSSGTTESGSSGSPALASWGSRRYVAGQLFAGSASCSFPDAPDYYGRFDKAYPSLRQWLGDVPGA